MSCGIIQICEANYSIGNMRQNDNVFHFMQQDFYTFVSHIYLIYW